MANAGDGTDASSKIIRYVQQTAEPKDMNCMGEAEPGGMQPRASNGPPATNPGSAPKMHTVWFRTCLEGWAALLG